MPHTIEELLTKAYSLKKFLKKEFRLGPPAPELRALRSALRTLRGSVKELRRLQKIIEVEDSLVFRIHRRRRLDLREFQKCVDEQQKKIDKIVAGMMFGVSDTNTCPAPVCTTEDMRPGRTRIQISPACSGSVDTTVDHPTALADTSRETGLRPSRLEYTHTNSRRGGENVCIERNNGNTNCVEIPNR